jgi:hypothetical protein
MARGALIAVLATVAAAAAVPQVASAADQDVYNAYVSRDSDFARLGKAFRAGERRWRRSHFRRPGKALRAARETQKLIDAVAAAVTAQASSSAAGERGKAAALDSLKLLRLELTHARRGLLAGTRGHPARATREFRRAGRLARRSLRAQKAARAAFTEAGVQVKP